MAGARSSPVYFGAASQKPSSTTGALSTGCFLRTVSSGPMRSADAGEVPTSLALPEDSLRDRIFRLRFPKRSATVALEKWVGEGGNVTAGELRRISRELRRAQRYKHALEISEWMISHHERELSTNDYAVRIGLISKVLVANMRDVHCSLHAYASAKLVEKAEFLFDKMKELRITINTLTFNEMMTLYISVGQAEKVPLVVEQLKSSSESADIFTYNLWISAYASTMDIDGISSVPSVEEVYMEMVNDSNVEVGWSTYSTLANIYTKHGLKTKAFAALKDAEDRLSMRNRLGFFFSSPSTLLWETSKKVAGRITSANYMCIILCLVKVGDIGEAEKVFLKWESECRKYDIRVPNVLRVPIFASHTLAKGGQPNYKTWEILIEGWTASKQMDKAVDAMKKGFSLLRFCAWRPSDEEQGDADEARRYIKALRRHRLMTLPLYKSYLRTCVRAQRSVPNALKMTRVDRVDLDQEALTLIQCVGELGVDLKENQPLPEDGKM
ncbi:unnamed protein product [Spirodela intermedia]|uniref:Uncharacterized protein n=1 Tax=Spirodela intermedia TaxID=51605 RepID=A0A7I8IPS4_SPIIN|nr:unnamed protein product [Spirodela intermedia]CAA6659483.1 unnamed protein product [Spirodela intermedia]